jgi:hypothetical protein
MRVHVDMSGTVRTVPWRGPERELLRRIRGRGRVGRNIAVDT